MVSYWHCVSNHQQLDCLFNNLFSLTTKSHQKSSLLITLTISWIVPSWKVTTTENISKSWRHHGASWYWDPFWKPAVKSTWLALKRIIKHGYIVSLFKTSIFSIVLNMHEPRAKGTNFEIYIPEITELIDHGSFYYCKERVLRVSTYYQYWRTSSNDLNSVTRNRCNKSFFLICVKERMLYLQSSAVWYVRIFICFR